MLVYRYTTSNWQTIHEAASVYLAPADDGARDLFTFSFRLPATLAAEMRLKFAIRYRCNDMVCFARPVRIVTVYRQ